MSCEFFTETNFRARTLEVIEQANVILLEYRHQGFKPTLRQLYYQFVARQLMPNEPPNMRDLAGQWWMLDRSGMIDWNSMEDLTRDLGDWASRDSPADILFGAAAKLEKAALAG